MAQGMIEAFRNLVEEHGKSFAPEQVLPSYDLHFDGPKVRLAVGGHTIEEHVLLRQRSPSVP